MKVALFLATITVLAHAARPSVQANATTLTLDAPAGVVFTQDGSPMATVAGLLAADAAVAPTLSALRDSLVAADAVVLAQAAAQVATAVAQLTTADNNLRDLLSSLSATLVAQNSTVTASFVRAAASTAAAVTKAASDLAPVASALVATQSTQAQLRSCVQQGLALNAGANGCTLPPAGVTDTVLTAGAGVGGCTPQTIGLATYTKGGNTLAPVRVCDGAVLQPVAMVPLGSKAKPGLDCGAVYNAGQVAAGNYWVGANESTAVSVYCNNGRQLYLPPFDRVGLPVSYFQFENTTNDFYGRLETVQTGPFLYSSSGVVSQAAVFSGANWFALPNLDLTFLENSWTVAVWVRIVDANAATANAVFSSGTAAPSAGLHLVETLGKIRFGLYSNDIDSTSQIDDNEWTHLTFVYNSNGRKTMYIDGHLAGTTLGARYTPSVGFNSAVGQSAWAGVSTPLIGLMDELIFWDKALSMADVETLYLSYVSRITPVSCGEVKTGGFPDMYYQLQNKSEVYCLSGVSQFSPPFITSIRAFPMMYFSFDNNAVRDMIGNTDPAAVTAVTFSAGVRVLGSSAVFNGATSIVDMSSLNPAFWKNAWTLSLWVRFNVLNKGSDNAIFAHGIPAVNQGLHCGERGGFLYFGMYGSDAASPTPLVINKWYHVVFQQTLTGTKRLWINGTLDINIAQPLYAGALSANSKIGTYAWPGHFLNGYLDDMYMFETALTDAQVLKLYTSYPPVV